MLTIQGYLAFYRREKLARVTFTRADREALAVLERLAATAG